MKDNFKETGWTKDELNVIGYCLQYEDYEKDGLVRSIANDLFRTVDEVYSKFMDFGLIFSDNQKYEKELRKNLLKMGQKKADFLAQKSIENIVKKYDF